MIETGESAERALLVGVDLPHKRMGETEESLDELALLADTAGAKVVGRSIQTRHGIDPTYFIGQGKIQKIAKDVERLGVDVLLFDEELSPAQARNIERMTKVHVVDRTGLILDIFVRRAQTKEARIQVELAQLKYLLPRLTRQWSHLSRQTGGVGRSGGIGMRGPGETQLETDRRHVRRRIWNLSQALSQVEKERAVQRNRRSDFFRAALVGYTNAGKSTLLNLLAHSEVFVEDRLFATLDATTRLVQLSSKRRILVTDTVGFIRKLPPSLIASFRSTLEEAIEADLLLHVVDVSHPACEEHIAVVEETLSDLGGTDCPVLLLLNKVDQLEQQGYLAQLRHRYPEAIPISAKKGYGMEHVRRALQMKVVEHQIVLDLTLSLGEGKLLAHLEHIGDVLERTYTDDRVTLRVRLDRREAYRLSAHMVKQEERHRIAPDPA